MVNTQLLDYVKQQLAQGMDKDAVRSKLSSSGGWDISDIDEAFSVLGLTANTPSVQSSVPPVPVKYAGFWIRWVAISVDGLILAIPVGIVQFLIGLALAGTGLSEIRVQAASGILGSIVPWIYFTLMTYYKGATLGKMLVGITVKSDTFNKLSFGKVLLRETVGKLVSGIILGIGYIIAGVTQKKQALHDKFAHSVVVYKDPSKSNKTGLIIGIIIAAVLPALAILGILSSVVLVSLNVARQKGQDAKGISNLSQMRVIAEQYYADNNNSYSHSQSCSSGMFSDKNIQQLIADMPMKYVTCYAEGTSYAISAALNTPRRFYCVDSSGYANDGVAIDVNSKSSCQVNVYSSTSTSQNQSKASMQPTQVSKALYSYTMPAGWESVDQNTGHDVEAINREKRYALSVTSTPLSPELMYATSILNVINKDTVKGAILSQNPSTVIESIDEGMLGGEKTYISRFNSDVTSPEGAAQTQSIKQSLVQYNLFHKGNAYTLVFVSTYDQRVDATKDYQAISNSFLFK